MAETFGARLRRQREQRDIALATIADKTKIKNSLLEALERDDVSHWPSGIFRRAFVRAYAHEIGLDPDAVVREFLELYPDPTEEVSALGDVATAAEQARASGHPPSRLGEFVRSLMGKSPEPEPPAIYRQPQESRSSVELASASTVPRRVNVESGLPEADLTALADLCTEFGSAARAEDLSPLLQKAAKVLNAAGLIVWKWDSRLERLRAHLAYGYSEAVLSHLPTVTREANNATAAAFRSGQLSTVRAAADARSALTLPIVGPQGSIGVLAIEFQPGHEASTLAGSGARIVAAQLSNFVDGQSRVTAVTVRTGPAVVTGEMGLAV
jgi:transcriptional regulator with XRE-family HTH domain